MFTDSYETGLSQEIITNGGFFVANSFFPSDFYRVPLSGLI